jgi:hypothetical protein
LQELRLSAPWRADEEEPNRIRLEPIRGNRSEDGEKAARVWKVQPALVSGHDLCEPTHDASRKLGGS